MKFRGVSHFAIGTTNIERALHFYCDLLGAEVVRDSPGQESVVPEGAGPGAAAPRGHVVHLAWGTGPHTTFITLTQHHPPVGNAAVPLNHVGLNHIGLWIDDFDATIERLNAASVPVVMAPLRSDSDMYPGGTGHVISTMVTDPDGTVLQLEQRLP